MCPFGGGITKCGLVSFLPDNQEKFPWLLPRTFTDIFTSPDIPSPFRVRRNPVQLLFIIYRIFSCLRNLIRLWITSIPPPPKKSNFTSILKRGVKANVKILQVPYLTISYFCATFFCVSLHCALASCGAVYCNRSCLMVCVCIFVCGSVTTITRNCVHRSSPNWVLGNGSDRLQLIKLWPSRAHGKVVCGGAKIFGSALLQPVFSVCVSPSAFHFECFIDCICIWSNVYPDL